MKDNNVKVVQIPYEIFFQFNILTKNMWSKNNLNLIKTINIFCHFYLDWRIFCMHIKKNNGSIKNYIYIKVKQDKIEISRYSY